MGGSSPTPADGGYFGWTYDTATLDNTTGSVVPSTGTVFLFKVPVTGSGSITTVRMWVNTAASGLNSNENYVGVYDTTGNLLGSSSDQSTNWQSTGKADMTLNGGTAISVSSPFVWVGVLVNGGTGATLPAFTRTNAANGSLTNGPLLSNSTTRFGSYGSSNLQLPGSIATSSISNIAGHFWAAIW